MLYKLCVRDEYGNWTTWSAKFWQISDAIEMGETIVRNSNYTMEYKVRQAL